jgi:FKBP-type peptidyl-prolyl cis-trans isomerase 2
MHWKSEQAEHEDCYLAKKVNIWRDFLPPGLEQAILGKHIGDWVEISYKPGQALEKHKESLVYSINRSRFNPRDKEVELKLGRFYPKGYLTGIVGIYPENQFPFRVVNIDEQEFRADLNHPLAEYEIDLDVQVQDIAEKFSEVGGRCNVWMEEIAEKGPGMQAQYNGLQTDFSFHNAFERKDNNSDLEFYKKPRLIGHIDSQASYFISQEYKKYLFQGAKVLDLMSSMQSHLPKNFDLKVTGLGLNQEEMEANPILQVKKLWDLNSRPDLPFGDQEFDTVICSLSIEYLLYPKKVLTEMIRVLKLEGKILFSMSNRWFPRKRLISHIFSGLGNHVRFRDILRVNVEGQ